MPNDNAKYTALQLLCLLSSLLACTCPGLASGSLQPMTQAIAHSDYLLELEVENVLKNEIHRTYHNGKIILINTEFLIACKVIKNYTSQKPAAGEKIQVRMDVPQIQEYDFDGNPGPRPFFDMPNSFCGFDAKKGVRFFAGFGAFNDLSQPVQPYVCRTINERKEWNVAIALLTQGEEFAGVLNKTLPPEWKTPSKIAWISRHGTQANPADKLAPKPASSDEQNKLQRNLMTGIEYSIYSTSHKASIKFIVMQKAYGQLPDKSDAQTAVGPEKAETTWMCYELPNCLVYLDLSMKDIDEQSRKKILAALQNAIQNCQKVPTTCTATNSPAK